MQLQMQASVQSGVSAGSGASGVSSSELIQSSGIVVSSVSTTPSILIGDIMGSKVLGVMTGTGSSTGNTSTTTRNLQPIIPNNNNISNNCSNITANNGVMMSNNNINNSNSGIIGVNVPVVSNSSSFPMLSGMPQNVSQQKQLQKQDQHRGNYMHFQQQQSVSMQQQQHLQSSDGAPHTSSLLQPTPAHHGISNGNSGNSGSNNLNQSSTSNIGSAGGPLGSGTTMAPMPTAADISLMLNILNTTDVSQLANLDINKLAMYLVSMSNVMIDQFIYID